MNETFWQRLSRGARRLKQREYWAALVPPNWADDIMDLELADRFHAKQGRSTCRWVLPMGGGEAAYLKRHYRISWWRGVLATLWPERGWSPALEEWRHLEWAKGQGLAVPEALAAGEFIGPWGRLQSLLAVRELRNMLPLHEAIPLAAEHLGPGIFEQWKRGLIEEIVRITRFLHERRHFHNDLYLCHFYISDRFTREVPYWRDRVYLIDLHRLRHQPLTWPLARLKDLAQLLFSSELAGIGNRDRFRFWRSYMGAQWRSRRARLLLRCILFKCGRYRRHDLRSAERLSSHLAPASRERVCG
jgi:heptose I phosphotransferase